jgi:hypothetical protein
MSLLGCWNSVEERRKADEVRSERNVRQQDWAILTSEIGAMMVPSFQK